MPTAHLTSDRSKPAETSDAARRPNGSGRVALGFVGKSLSEIVTSARYAACRRSLMIRSTSITVSREAKEARQIWKISKRFIDPSTCPREKDEQVFVNGVSDEDE